MLRSARNMGAESNPRVPSLWLWVGISFLVHLNMLLWLAALSSPRRHSPDSVQVVFSERDSEPAPADETQRYVDIPDEVRDEAPPEAETDRIGIRNLLARDPEPEEGDEDTPRVEEGEKAPVFRPGSDAPVDGLEERPPVASAAPPGVEIAPPGAPETPPEETFAPEESAGQPDDPPESDPDTPEEDSPRETERPARPGPPHLASRPGSAPYVLAFPRRGYIDDSPGDTSRAGRAQYNVKWDEYAPYYKHLFGRIESAIRVRMRLNYRRPFRLDEPKAITIGFRVAQGGAFEGLEIVDDAGLPLLASDLADGVRSASPADPFPDFVQEESLNIRVRFYAE